MWHVISLLLVDLSANGNGIRLFYAFRDGKPMCKKCFLKLPPEIRKKLAKKADKEKKKK